ncbi:hypothetical protein BDK51DRAFT_34370 [Blyttiomyces helicus]|uniref:Cytochrome b5 heme-binding domain-containing protein n=1 Tax=Blyttiomyces helicus TaxID=388810 RepID=A0A4P9WQE0_9FUNG|nr:hypothetical protein BDK51DRAFT_34370 [Blyttiomyces helicus]|eukprot:RKO93086.1 hypothetical protein BDK51DRAFT_34370 [Blyttiomyces helicus]
MSPILMGLDYVDQPSATVIIAHFVAALSLQLYAPAAKTWVFTYVIWQLATLCITVGCHRLWSHRPYKAMLPLQVVLSMMGPMVEQRSIRRLTVRHTPHHTTDDDPYNATKGFWYSHVGWLCERSFDTKMKLVDAKDSMKTVASKAITQKTVEDFDVVRHKHFVPLLIVSNLIIPKLVATPWDDALGGFLYGGFHHEFPNDHCSGIKAISNNLSKWLICVLSQLGLAHSPICTPVEEITKAKKQTSMQRRCSEEGFHLMVIDGFMVDLSCFGERHPGGKKVLLAYRGVGEKLLVGMTPHKRRNLLFAKTTMPSLWI